MPHESPFHTDSPEYPPRTGTCITTTPCATTAERSSKSIASPALAGGHDVTAATPWPVRNTNGRFLELSRRLFGSSAN